jgi:hypothetical protein
MTAPRAGTDCALGIERFVMHGNDEHREIFVFDLEPLNQVEAVAVPEGDVNDDKVRLEIGDRLHGRWGIGDFATDFERCAAINHLAKAFQEKRMIIHEEDAAFLRCLGHSDD